ncbi:MAG: hypothetical protein C0501_18000 [Isosphaera sp.]|nr:hypothetical protein [Isosphaera sp.]
MLKFVVTAAVAAAWLGSAGRAGAQVIYPQSGLGAPGFYPTGGGRGVVVAGSPAARMYNFYNIGVPSQYLAYPTAGVSPFRTLTPGPSGPRYLNVVTPEYTRAGRFGFRRR